MANESKIKMWMVRAGRNGVLAEDFESSECVAYAGSDIADVCSIDTKDKMEQHIRNRLPNLRKAQLGMLIGQCVRFALEMKEGDRVITYVPDRRVYLIGTLTGGCKHEPGRIGDLVHLRTVKWNGSVSRDDVSVSAKNTLGAIMSIFLVRDEVARELLERMQGKTPPTGAEEEDSIEELRLETEERGRAFIVDKVASLDWDQMQDIVAGILRAMGFKTRLSMRGPDQGRDIMASPDGLGLSPPRIIVEVKHRPNEQANAQMIRSFLGGRRQGDNGMYVSTGGFTKDARYEAERANIPVALVTLEELVDLLLQHYANADAETRALVPVVSVFWPAAS